MTQQQQTPASDPAAPPEAFVERVKDTLEHRYDFAYLQRHPLWENAGDINGEPQGLQTQKVRDEVLTAIEGLTAHLHSVKIRSADND